MNPKSDFIHNWITNKKEEKQVNQEIILAIDECLSGIQNQDLDEAKFLKLLQELNQGGK
jgi:hypothetical protein